MCSLELGCQFRSGNCLSLVTTPFIGLEKQKKTRNLKKQVITLFPGIGTVNFLTEDHSEMYAD